MDIAEEGAPLSYCCPSCTARFLGGERRDAQTCPYCGATLQPAEPADPQARPQRIVPFAVSLDEAHERLRKHLSWGGILQKGGRPSIESAEAVYVPHCLLDVFAYGDVGFCGKSARGHGRNNVVHFRYRIRAHGYGEFLMNPIAASACLPHDLTQAIAPYDLDEARSLEGGLLATGVLEAVGKSAHDAQECAKEIAYDRLAHATRKYVYETVREDFPTTLVFTENNYRIKLDDKTEDWGHGASILESSSVALPVWVLRCNWKGECCIFVINGQTGKCAGGPCEGQGLWSEVDMSKPYDVQSEQQVNIGRIRTIRRELNTSLGTAVAPDFSMSETIAPYDRSSWRQTAMYDFASRACEEYGRQVASRGIEANSLSTPMKRFVPINEDPISIFDDTFGNDPLHGFAMTDAGLWCIPAETMMNITERYFTRWAEFAWSDRPLSASRYDRTLIYSNGNAIAFCPQHGRLRSDFTHLYLTLWQKARELFGWEWFVSTHPKAAAQVVMSNTAHTLCRRMTFLMEGGKPQLSRSLHGRLRIGRYEEVLLTHDNSRGEGDNSAFAITAHGVTCRGRNTSLGARFVDWEELSRASSIRLEGEYVRADDVAIACYDGDRSTREALLALFEELHAEARKAYGGRAGLYMLHK